ncbi:hypothetical protein D3C72_1450130 [compost metagenome]
MVPSSATKAAVSGSKVFFIQKHCMAGCSNTNSMPSAAGISLRCIKPTSRWRGVWAIWAWMRCMPADSSVRCRFICGSPAVWAVAERLSADRPRARATVEVRARKFRQDIGKQGLLKKRTAQGAVGVLYTIWLHR